MFRSQLPLISFPELDRIESGGRSPSHSEIEAQVQRSKWKKMVVVARKKRQRRGERRSINTSAKGESLSLSREH